MAKNDFLEGIRKGMLAFLQTRQMMQEYQGNQLQQETYKMQQDELKLKKQDYMSPQAKADFDFAQGLKRKRAELELAKEFKPKGPDVAESLRMYNEQLKGTDYRGVYNPITNKIDRFSTRRGGAKEGKESGKGELFLKLISNMDYPEAKKFTEETYKGFTLVLGKTGDYEIVDKNKEVDPVEAGNMLNDLFTRTKREQGEFSPRKIQEMRKELMTGDPQKILELESALYAGGLLREFSKKIGQLGTPDQEAALTRAVAEWWLGVNDGTIFADKTAPQSEGELRAQIQEFLSGTSTIGPTSPLWFRNKVLSYIGKGMNYVGGKALLVPPAIIGAYGKGVKSAFSWNPEQKK